MIEELQKQFAIPEIHFRPGNGGLTLASINTPAGGAEVYLHGAHVTHFHPRGKQPVLYLSSASAFQAGKAIRGGVPICWPWFGPHPTDPKLPMHGLARTREWKVESTRRVDQDHAAITLRLESDQTTRLLWPHDFLLRYTVIVGAALEMQLEFTNRSDSGVAVSEALHSYLAVGDIERISVSGLKGARYFDKVKNERAFETREKITLANETDCVYLDTSATVTISDPAMGRTLHVEKSGSNATVLWNPFEAKAKTMADLGADEWRKYVCVEAANALENLVMVEAGETHRISTTLRVA